ncbi:MAG: tRNA (N6-threonylcarbamoyladenosine(37)-N6)-methyltransferase TrmO [Syntrophobacterales bacterium]|nr:tRNA (N6-threonylcarbamoyladenosine(37)-N6)-methyltransferase TrmO [Syntrophobacterales bacterium]
MDKIQYTPIGVIRSPFKQVEGMPIQPAGAKGIAGSVEIYEMFAEGLKDLEGFSHIILIYHLHRSRGFKLHVKPFLDDQLRGVFATRAPRRPNAIGISVVRLLQVDRNILKIEDVDILDGTPLLDIKPYVPAFDEREAVRTGWLSSRAGVVAGVRSDERFKSAEE